MPDHPSGTLFGYEDPETFVVLEVSRSALGRGILEVTVMDGERNGILLQLEGVKILRDALTQHLLENPHA